LTVELTVSPVADLRLTKCDSSINDDHSVAIGSVFDNRIAGAYPSAVMLIIIDDDDDDG